MDERAIIATLQQSPQECEILRRVFDFELTEPDLVEPDVILQSKHALSVIAQDGAGGIFVQCDIAGVEQKPVLYVSSEGEAGIIAPDVVTALQLVVQLPYWRDCLKFSGGGDLAEMSKTLPYLEREIHEDEPLIDDYRETLWMLLGSERLPYPVETLYEAVQSTSEICGVITQNGNALNTLFNTFVVADNRMWRNTPLE
jgi:hypothetical protein